MSWTGLVLAWVLQCIVFCVLGESTDILDQKSIRVGLHAQWAPTSLVAEAAEWISVRPGSSDQFWGFIERVSQLRKESYPDPTAQISERDVFDLITAAWGSGQSSAKSRTTSSALAVWALNSRLMSPRVYVQGTLAEEALASFSAPKLQHSVFGLFGRNSTSQVGLLSTLSQLRDVIGLCNSGDSSGIELDFDLSLSNTGGPELSESSPSLLEDLYHLRSPLSDDHVYRGRDCSAHAATAGGPDFEVILYGDPLDTSFSEWIELLSAASDACRLRYTFRFWSPHRFSSATSALSPGLQGYAVEVALKSTEYKVRDDVVFERELFENCAFGDSQCEPATTGAEASVLSSDIDVDVVRKESAGLVAARVVIEEAGGDPLLGFIALRSFAEALPLKLTTAYRGDSFESGPMLRAATGVRSVPGLAECLFINGRRILLAELAEDLEKPLSCLTTVASVGETLRHLFERLSPTSVLGVSKFLKTGARKSGGMLRVDLTIDSTYSNIITWFNDLEKDSRYAAWPEFNVGRRENVLAFVESVKDAEDAAEEDDSAHMRAQGLVPVRSNMIYLTLVMDFANPSHSPYLGLAETIVRGMLPVRYGIVFVPTSRVSTLCAGLFHYSLEIGGLHMAVSFLGTMAQVAEYVASGMQGMQLSEPVLEMIYGQMRGQSGGRMKYASVSDIVLERESVRERLLLNRRWAVDAGIIPRKQGKESWDPSGENAADGEETSPSFTIAGVLNGILLEDIGGDALEIAILEQRRIAALLDADTPEVLLGTERGSMNAWISFDSQLLMIPRLAFVKGNSKVNDGKVTSGDSPGNVVKPAHAGSTLVPLSILAESERDLVQIEYISQEEAKSAEGTFPSTLWLLSKNEDSNIYRTAHSHLLAFGRSQVSLVCRVRASAISSETAFSRRVLASIQLSDVSTVFVLNGVVHDAEQFIDESDLEVFVSKEISSNGAPIAASFGSDANADVALLAMVAFEELDQVCGALHDDSDLSRKLSPWDKIASGVHAADGNATQLLLQSGAGDDPVGDVSLSLVVDPIGKYAALAGSFLETVLEVCGTVGEANLLLVPPPRLPSEGPGMLSPVFSRAVFSHLPSFDKNSGRLLAPGAELHRLPQDALLTVGVVPPRAWFVAPYATSYDLDNVVLSSLPTGVSTLHAQYSLQSLLVEGSCVDEKHRPPQGLRLKMRSRIDTSVDTIVMANLGYFQLRVPKPGRWLLNIAKGRSRDLYDIGSIRRSSNFGGLGQSASKFSSDVGGEINVLVDSLGGARGTYLEVNRKPGSEGVPLLDPSRNKQVAGEPSGGVFQRALKSILSRASEDAASTKDSAGPSAANDGRIHVFSVASGHLYERFLKIMMLSVTKHASAPVKFWLLENYLSPSFKKVIPDFAAAHSFEVEMVTYRWPSWLREQTEKQRIIWAYKILFLDVLFPLGLHRVIFVDSDQVVRGDLMELMKMDLDGAPYGYVPFCDSRKEVDGFRFWKTGFWKNTLRGAHYHISALYVVDLDTFRETSAGDTLRFAYQSLSADPNSLSNLDQDLPNYAAVVDVGGGKVVPIFDLPQEWLWCESWCDDASKANAKTIDLCNNPMTKEPKLQSAKRILGEWVSLDEEAFRTTNEIHRNLSAAPDSTASVDPENSERLLVEDDASKIKIDRVDAEDGISDEL